MERPGATFVNGMVLEPAVRRPNSATQDPMTMNGRRLIHARTLSPVGSASTHNSPEHVVVRFSESKSGGGPLG